MNRSGKGRLIAAAIIATSLTAALPMIAEESPPPCSDEPYRQFDFWLGHWTAYDADGKKQGDNHLHQVMGECAVQENWTSVRGDYSGTSYNFYDARTRLWHQTWIDNQGGHLFLSGEFDGERMRLSGDAVDREGNPIINRITWTPLDDGRVRQHWQVSRDDGESWIEAFDGYYERTEPEGRDAP